MTLGLNGAINEVSDLQLMQRFLEMTPSPFFGDLCSCWDSISCWLEKKRLRGFYRNDGFGRRCLDLFFLFARIVARTWVLGEVVAKWGLLVLA